MQREKRRKVTSRSLHSLILEIGDHVLWLFSFILGRWLFFSSIYPPPPSSLLPPSLLSKADNFQLSAHDMSSVLALFCYSVPLSTSPYSLPLLHPIVFHQRHVFDALEAAIVYIVVLSLPARRGGGRIFREGDFNACEVGTWLVSTMIWT